MPLSRYTVWQAQTIKVLRTSNAELSRRITSVSALNTALRNENAKLRREIARLSKASAKAGESGCPKTRRSRSGKSPS